MRARRIVALVVLTTSLSTAVMSCGGPARSEALAGEGAVVPVAPAEPQTEPQAEPQAADPPPGLGCIQNALGGVRAIGGVSSLLIVGDTKPAASSGPRPIPGRQEISVIFPDRYKRAHAGHVPGGGSLSSTTGFDGRAILSSPSPPDAMRSAQQDFVRQMLMRLPRALAGVSLSQRTARDAGQERLALDASGPTGVVTLLADSKTCVPVALQYLLGGALNIRVDLSGHRTFGGIRFPTVLTTSRNGVPSEEERVSRVEVNAPGADRYFAGGR